MKKALYTINFGKYDSLKDPSVITPGWDYICFTNNKDLESDIWKLIYVEPEMPNPMAARFYYTQSCDVLPDYDITIAIGGQIRCDCNLDEFLNNYINLNYDYNLMNHCRNCTYKEAEENKKFFGDKGVPMIQAQMNAYRQYGFPPEFGLYAHGIIVCKHNQFVKEHQKLWWREIINPKYVLRDQLSFMFTTWKHKLIRHRSFAEYWDFLHSGMFSVYSHGYKNKKL